MALDDNTNDGMDQPHEYSYHFEGNDNPRVLEDMITTCYHATRRAERISFRRDKIDKGSPALWDEAENYGRMFYVLCDMHESLTGTNILHAYPDM